MTVTKKAKSSPSDSQRGSDNLRHTKDGVAARRLVKRRWDAVDQSEADIREFFATAPMNDIMIRFGKMRLDYELASRCLDDRVQADNSEACANCGKKFDKDHPWMHRDPVKDPSTQRLSNVFACSQPCWIANQDKMRADGLRQSRF